jgi:hypothetical protein
MGCGQPLGTSLPRAFRDQKSRNEYDITGLCQRCQDELFKPSAEKVAEMAEDVDNYGRCMYCGEYRPYECVDVGIGVMKGFDCCEPTGLPRCTKVRGCLLDVDHQHRCEIKSPGGQQLVDPDELEAVRQHEEGKPHFDGAGLCRCTCQGCIPFGCGGKFDPANSCIIHLS